MPVHVKRPQEQTTCPPTEAKWMAEEAMKNTKSDIDLAAAQGEVAATQKLRKNEAADAACKLASTPLRLLFAA